MVSTEVKDSCTLGWLGRQLALNKSWCRIAASMPVLAAMPALAIPTATLASFGAQWTANGNALSRTPPHSSSQLGQVFDSAVGAALATMLGGIPVVPPTNSNALIPPQVDCVEVGPTRIIGGVRPQNFDVCYRPDGVRFAFDSKTLNDTESVRKNYQNMINDLATEATTVHTRFPYAVVAFVVVIPTPCLADPQRAALIGTLDRLARRANVTDHSHLAEVISLVTWDPVTGGVTPNFPSATSRLRIEAFSDQVSAAYLARYEGLPPHTE